jgi:hypothetical protein
MKQFPVSACRALIAHKSVGDRLSSVGDRLSSLGDGQSSLLGGLLLLLRPARR